LSLILGNVVPYPSSSNVCTEVTLNRERVTSLFESNPMSRLRVLDVNLTLASIAVARALLAAMPSDAELIATLNVKEGNSFDDFTCSEAAFTKKAAWHHGFGAVYIRLQFCI
jgi:hypothetical protein